MDEPMLILRDRECPLTGKPCKARSCAECKHFWECLRQAQQRAQGASGALAPPGAQGGTS